MLCLETSASSKCRAPAKDLRASRVPPKSSFSSRVTPNVLRQPLRARNSQDLAPQASTSFFALAASCARRLATRNLRPLEALQLRGQHVVHGRSTFESSSSSTRARPHCGSGFSAGSSVLLGADGAARHLHALHIHVCKAPPRSSLRCSTRHMVTLPPFPASMVLLALQAMFCFFLEQEKYDSYVVIGKPCTLRLRTRRN